MKRRRLALILTFVCSTGTPVQARQSGAPTIESDTSKAFCRHEFPGPERMRAELSEASKAPPLKSSGVGGASIRNENARLLDAYRLLVSHKDYQFRPVQDLDLWHLFKNGSCEKALCAAETVFGPEAGLVYLYLAWKYGLVASHLGLDRLRPPTPADQTKFDAYFSVRPWRLEEMLPYLKALPMLPTTVRPLPWTRFHQAGIVNPLNPDILSNGIIVFYSPMAALPENHIEHTVFHEIGHVVGHVTGLDASKAWLEASGWRIEGSSVKNPRPEAFPSRYAMKDVFEDFAESFVFYRYNPDRLRERSPERYGFMKQFVFGGKEFLDSSECSAP